MEYKEWGEEVTEGEIIIDIKFSDLTGERYEKLKERYWGEKE